MLSSAPSASSSGSIVRWLFLRTLGVTNLVAFTSLRTQLLGLYGRGGIAPIHDFLTRLRAHAGRDAYRLAPSLLWLGSSDRDLVRLCGAGQAAALALTLGVAPRLMVVAEWALYLSFVSVGQDFLFFQWDVLLLEAGAHAALIAPGGLAPGLGRRGPSRPGVLLMRWLAFRLHFQSGLVKLQSGDPTWRRCTACAYHYETQPLPTPLGWYAHHLPRSVQRLSTGTVLALELGAPLLALGRRRARLLAFALLGALQALIAASGNFAFFNLLTAALGLWLLDDRALGRWPGVRRLLRRRSRARPPALWRRLAAAVASAPLAIASVLTFVGQLRARPLPAPLERFQRALEPFRSINSYGLFAMMTTARPEIVVEGSDDGRTWRAYGFRYKPSRPEDPPRFIAPHQPRLDWQMWFAALGAPPAWFATFVRRLLEGSPEVLALLRSNPFPDGPPRFVRARLYELRATDIATRRRTGAWWRRELVGNYFPVRSLDSYARRGR